MSEPTINRLKELKAYHLNCIDIYYESVDNIIKELPLSDDLQIFGDHPQGAPLFIEWRKLDPVYLIMINAEFEFMPAFGVVHPKISWSLQPKGGKYDPNFTKHWEPAPYHVVPEAKIAEILNKLIKSMDNKIFPEDVEI